jgi:hypothetical protein
MKQAGVMYGFRFFLISSFGSPEQHISIHLSA